MLKIKSVEDAATVDAAKELFREYGEFLRERIASSDHFDFDRFLGEIDRLPADYADRGGEVLIGFVEDSAAAIIAYRESTYEGPESAEIKRLFVRPEYRGQGLARQMVEEMLTRVRARGFSRAILDTHLEFMPGAFKLYKEIGFEEYGERLGSLVFLEMEL